MRDRNLTETAKLAWELFQKTGDVGYYMLYCDLSRNKRDR